MICRQQGYIGPIRLADCKRPPWNSVKVRDFRRVATVGRWSVGAEPERDRRAPFDSVGVPSWVVALVTAIGILRIVRDFENRAPLWGVRYQRSPAFH
jgi:hypothetical protein